MLKSTIFICIIIQCLISCSLVLCDEDNIIYSEGDTNNDLDSEPKKYDKFDNNMDKDKHEKIYKDYLNLEEALIDPHSLFYDRYSKKVIEDIEVFSTELEPAVSSSKRSNEQLELKKCNEDFGMLKVYYKRLIMMLLLNSNLKMEDDLVEGHLFIKGTKTQIETLKKVETKNYSLKEIDLILCKIILEPSLVDIVSGTINLGQIIQSVFEFVNSYIEVISIASSGLAAVILCRVMPWRRMLFLSIVIGISVSIFMTYLQLVKEAEVKFAAMQVKYTDMPAACKSSNMGVWEKLKSFFSNDDCEKYYEAKISNPNLKVTPALVLTHFLSTIIFHPISIFGEAMSKYLDTSTANLNWLMKLPITVLLVLLLPIFLVAIFISLRGGHIRLGFSRLFNCTFSVSGENQLSTADAQRRQTIELIREVIAERVEFTPQQITTNNDLPNALAIKENDSPTGNVSEKSYKLMPDKSVKELNPASNVSEKPFNLMSDKFVKELNPAGGDADQNNLFSEESEEKTGECIGSSEISTEIGGGDA